MMLTGKAKILVDVPFFKLILQKDNRDWVEVTDDDLKELAAFCLLSSWKLSPDDLAAIDDEMMHFLSEREKKNDQRNKQRNSKHSINVYRLP